MEPDPLHLVEEDALGGAFWWKGADAAALRRVQDRSAVMTGDRLGATAAMLVLLLSAAPARAQTNRDKIDPVLRPLLEPAIVAQIERAPQLEALAGINGLPFVEALVLTRRPGPTPTMVDVLVSLTSRSPAVLASAGADVRVAMGSLFAARVPVAALTTLAADPAVRYIQSAGRVELTNDLAMADIRADQVRTRVGDTFTGATGTGVITGFVDTGIDWMHEDFKHLDGSTRILYIWDQTQFGTPPGFVDGQQFWWGNECDAMEIDWSSCLEVDTHGHGTHVAGTAAGNGSATGNGEPAFQYVGVAPNADIIMVKTTLHIVDVLEGVQYIFRRAAEIGKPAVVNLSLGTTYTAHDGSDLQEQAIDSLTGPGRIVVVSAGNEGKNRNAARGEVPLILRHATRTLTGVGDAADLIFTVPPYTPNSGNNNGAWFNLWYDSRDRIVITVHRPDGTSLAAGSGDSAVVSDAPGGRISIDASTIMSPVNGDAHVSLAIHVASGAQPPMAGDWRITVEITQRGGSGRFDIWEYATTLSGSTFTGTGDNAYNVNAPGNARRAITVGAYTTRTSWDTPTYTGVYYAAHSALGDLATFSSSGPTRPTSTHPSRQKPDLAAPGTAIISALSAQASPAASRIATDGVHRINQGTSMAAPMVTGATALLLESNGSLTPEDVQWILTRSARQDAFTVVSWAGFGGGTPNPSWGYGKLDVYTALGGDRLVVSAGPHLPAQHVTIGTIPVLQVVVGASTVEDVQIDSLSVTGQSSGLLSAVQRLSLYRDSAGTGAVPASAPLSAIDSPFANGPTVMLPTPGVPLPAGSQEIFLIVAEISDRLRQGDSLGFSLGGIQATGMLTHARAGVVMTTPPSSALNKATLLADGEAFLVSENPVRSGRVIFTYASPPTSMALYSFAGVRLRHFTQLPPDRFEWDLRGESPGVPNGMYVLVVTLEEQVLRQRLMILSEAR